MMLPSQNLKHWFHESVSCLHDGMAVVLLYYGYDPIDTLGARWSFFHDSAAVTQEEFYYPSPTGHLGLDLAPFHGLKADWRCAPDGKRLLADVVSAVREGRPVLVVEDNFHMPNRPAYQDVHAAHLVLVTGYEDETRTFRVLECTPPLYHGPISYEQFYKAVGSDNEAREASRDYFFAGRELAFRWIDIQNPPLPSLEPAASVETIIRQNVTDLRAPASHVTPLKGLIGLNKYLTTIVETAATDERIARTKLSEIYTVGWAHLAQTALHADYLKAHGLRLQRPTLLLAARRVDHVAAAWTGLRLWGAHGAHGDVPVGVAVEQLRRRIRPMISLHEAALEALETTLNLSCV